MKVSLDFLEKSNTRNPIEFASMDEFANWFYGEDSQGFSAGYSFQLCEGDEFPIDIDGETWYINLVEIRLEKVGEDSILFIILTDDEPV